MFARRALDVLDDLLARARSCFSCLSHVPLPSGYDEPETLSYQITLFGPIGPDVRHVRPTSTDVRHIGTLGSCLYRNVTLYDYYGR